VQADLTTAEAAIETRATGDGSTPAIEHIRHVLARDVLVDVMQRAAARRVRVCSRVCA
jgi:hypothetical protein